MPVLPFLLLRVDLPLAHLLDCFYHVRRFVFQHVAEAFLTFFGGKDQLVIMVKSCENNTVGWKIFHPFTISFIYILVISDLTIMRKKEEPFKTHFTP